jgi:hypothetical protein
MDHKEDLWLQGLRRGRTMRFRPLGGSMVPFIRPDDVVTIVPGKQCRPGDVVLVHRGDALLLHRVVAIFSGRIITKGDALSLLDMPVSPQDILGRAVCLERQGRWRSLESLRSRLLGLAFNLAFSWLPSLARRWLFLKKFWRQGMLLSQSLR